VVAFWKYRGWHGLGNMGNFRNAREFNFGGFANVKSLIYSPLKVRGMTK